MAYTGARHARPYRSLVEGFASRFLNVNVIDWKCDTVQEAGAVSVQVGQSRRHVGMVWLIAAMCVVIGIPVAGAEWRSLKTEHFYVHFPAERAELATYVATRAE